MKRFRGSCLLLVGVLGLPGAATAVDLSIAGLTVTQATQSDDQSIPLVTDRRALVRVFVVADEENALHPNVRLQFVYGKKIRHQITFAPQRDLTGVPLAVDRNDHSKSWNALVPAGWVKPGLKLVAEVDPDRRVRESDEANNVWPGRQGVAFDVRNSPPLKVTFVPVRLPDGRTSEVNARNVEQFIGYTRRVFPVPEKVDVAIHRVFATSADVLNGFDGWLQLIQEIEALRVTERARDRLYAGLINPAARGTVGGLAFLGGQASVSTEWPTPIDKARLTYREYVIGHEVGHNLGLPHAPCGAPAGADPNFPYEDAGIGRHGYDVFVSRAYTPESGSVDLMSYCNTEPWISDYHYLKVLERRGQVSRPRRSVSETEIGAAIPVEGDALLVWGRQSAAGWVLDPAFRVRGVSEAVSGLGSDGAEIELLDAAGRVVARQEVRLAELDHLPGRVFAALVPLEGPLTLAGVRLKVDGRVVAERHRGGEGNRAALAAEPRAFRTDAETVLLAWDAAVQPLALLRDADTGEVLAFARDGRIELASRAERIEVLLSNGVDSVKRTFEVP